MNIPGSLFTSYMKLICIETPILPAPGRNQIITPFLINNIYETEGQIRRLIGFIWVLDSDNKLRYVPSKCFMILTEWRDRQLDIILL